MPGNNCIYCSNNSSRCLDTKFHIFPKDEFLKEIWLSKCSVDRLKGQKVLYACSNHFNKSDYINERLKKEAVPSIFNNENTTEVKMESWFVDTDSINNLMPDLNKILISSEEWTRVIEENKKYEIALNNFKESVEVLTNSVNKQKVQIEEMKRTLKLKNDLIRFYQTKQYSERKIEHEIKRRMSHVFSESQINLILDKKKHVRWSSEDIGRAMNIRQLSPQVYVYLKKLEYPLPSIRCLQMWTNKLSVKNGFLYNALDIMKSARETMPNLHKYCILLFDSMQVKSFYEYDQAKDKVITKYSQMQVLMVKSLFGNWKQPIYVDFDQKMIKHIILKSIEILEEIGYNVYGCVSNFEHGNVDLMKEFELTPDNSFFINPKTNQPIFYLPDVPDLMNLFRKQFLEFEFVLEDDTCIMKKPMEEFVKMKSVETKFSFKMQEDLLIISGNRRKDLEITGQIFSKKLSSTLKKYVATKGDLEKSTNAEFLSDFIDLVNEWFNVMNSTTKKNGFGANLEIQEEVLINMSNLINSMDELQDFHKAILISIKNIKELYSTLLNKDKSIRYILTKKINRDALENFFKQIRQDGKENAIPSKNQAVHRIKNILLQNLKSEIEETEESHEEYLTCTYFTQEQIQIDNDSDVTEEERESKQEQGTSEEEKEITEDVEIEITEEDKEIMEEEGNDTTEEETSEEIKETAEDTVEYISGLIAKEFNSTHPHLASKITLNTDHFKVPSWVEKLAEEGSIKPSQEWFNQCKLMNNYFEKNVCIDSNIENLNNIVLTLSSIIKSEHSLSYMDDDIINAFFRLRICVRINFLNNLQKFNGKRKRKCGSFKEKKKLKT